MENIRLEYKIRMVCWLTAVIGWMIMMIKILLKDDSWYFGLIIVIIGLLMETLMAKIFKTK